MPVPMSDIFPLLQDKAHIRQRTLLKPGFNQMEDIAENPGAGTFF